MLSHALKAIVVIATLLVINQQGRPLLAEDGIRCLGSDGCYVYSNCSCTSGNFYAQGCNGSTLQGICTGNPENPPGTATCQRSPCPPDPLPSCQLNGTFCFSDSECCSDICSRENNMCGGGSPILLNLANNNSHNPHLTSPADGVMFDIDGAGQPEQIGWTEAGSPIAFLGMDRNSNGTIDDGSELFGDSFVLSTGNKATNGFEALADLDRTQGNDDGVVDGNDPFYASLLVWQDSNHNGFSEATELQSLVEAQVLSVFTDYSESRRTDRNGNRYAFVGSATIVKNGKQHRRVVFDVIFAMQR